MHFGNHTKVLKTAVKLLSLLLILLLAVAIYQSYMILHPPRRNVTVSPSYLGMDYENVVFNSSDGLQLDGWLMLKNGSGSLVIVCHGHGSNKGDVIRIAEMLHRNGYSTFMFDFRAHGESEGDLATLGWLETNDLKGAVEYIKETVNPDGIGVIGFSMGGAVAITAAGQTNDIRAVVSDSAFADRSKLISIAVENVLPAPFGYLTVLFVRAQGINLDENLPANHVEKISPNALLIIQGDKDHLVEVEDAKLLYENAKDPKELWLAENTPHVGAFWTNRKEYEKRVLGFFDEYLKE